MRKPKEYPPLTRETLVGTWQGLIGMGTQPVFSTLSSLPATVTHIFQRYIRIR